MARVVGRSRVREGGGMGAAEMLVMAGIVVGLILGVRYYINYRHGPSYILSSYLSAIKAGNVRSQYDLIDDSDKQSDYPTLVDYDKNAKQAHGYTERIVSFTFTSVTIDPKQPNIARIDAAITLRAINQSELWQVSSALYHDHYTMRKDKDGQWKVWLRKSRMDILNAQPNPPVTNIMNG